MKLKYIESDIGKKKLKIAKRVDLVYLISIILVTISYIILCLDTKKLNGIIVFSIIYIIVSLFIKFIKRKHISRIITETLSQEICLDGFINLNIYNAKKNEKKFNHSKFNKVYNYSLLNLIDGYLRKGDFEQSNAIINVLEKMELDNTVKAFLIRYKATIAFNIDNKEEFNTQCKKFEEISNSITEKIKNSIVISLDLQKNILENNESEANKICEQLINNKLLLNKVMGYYYKGVILETNNKEEYKECYKFVVENGNDLNIAKIASDKTGIAQQIKYKRKRHVGFKIFTSLLFIILAFSTIFISVFYVENTKEKRWDIGIVYINNKKVELPCAISEFEETMNVKIDVAEINSSGFYKLYLNQNYFDVVDYNLSSEKYIELLIKDNDITGVKVDISNTWNDELDVELGEMVVFPEEITANSQIEEIQETYKTGIINPAMRDWSEDIVNPATKETIHSYGFNYSGDKYNISIDCKNGKVESIFYYYK